MKVVSFGEILWDLIDGKAYIGGAPFNVAAHLAKMGVRSAIISAVGSDALGADALSAARGFGVDVGFVSQLEDLPTGTVEVVVREEGQPSYVIHENVAWDAIALDAGQIEKLGAERWDVFCFGTLAQRSATNRELLREALRVARPARVLFDVNLRQSYYRSDWVEDSLGACDILKLNGEEVDVLSKMLFGEPLDVEPFCELVSKRFEIPVVCVTLGAEGAAIHENGSNAWVPAVPVTVADTVGSGDAFAAGFMFALLHDKTPVEATNFACRVGAWVASQRGALPDYSADIVRQLEKIRTGNVVR